MAKTIELIAPDDWHCHLRDEKYLKRTVFDVTARFQRAIIMPNLTPPITTIDQAEQYRQRICQHIPKENNFSPLMTLYLTESMPVETITAAKRSGFIVGAKLYPAGATTHSSAGIHQLHTIYPLLAEMEKQNLVLMIHGESIAQDIDIFDREAHFIHHQLTQLLTDFPKLRIVLEHISTETAVDFVKNGPPSLAATITPHHLLLNRNDLLLNKLHPHYYCLPILKRASDQRALINAAISGDPKFFLGTDSAPHAKKNKESSCGCAGIYSSHAAIELYTEIFDHHNALSQLEKFASINGPTFYQLPINSKKITLKQSPWQVSEYFEFGDEQLVPLRAGKKVMWQIQYANE